jgi:hypothetical protein
VQSRYLDDAFPSAPRTVLLEGESVPTPETATMSLDPFAGYLKAPSYWAPTVVSAELTGALFCPVNSCVMTADREVVAESTGPGARAVQIDTHALLETSALEPVEGVWTALRCPFNDFYHFLIDNLSRFDLLNEPFFRRYPQINVFCPGRLSPLEEFFVSRLCPDNVRLVPVERGRLYRPETYLFNSFMTKRASGYVRGGFVERLRESVGVRPTPRRPGNRILISRAGAANRRILNEADLLQALSPLGFERYRLETLSIEEQIALFHDAECVVAPHGAGLANLVFAPETAVVELFGSRFVVPHYYLLTKALGHRYTFRPGYDDRRDANVRVEVDHIFEIVRSSLNRSPRPQSWGETSESLPHDLRTLPS